MSVNDNVVPLSKIYLYLFSKKIVIQMIIKIGKTCLIIFFFVPSSMVNNGESDKDYLHKNTIKNENTIIL